MVCYHPKFAKYNYVQKIDEETGEIYKTKQLRFLSPTELDIETPFKDNITAIPCGKCIGCKIDKANDWATRAAIESSQYEKNTFLTLTYDEKHLPEKKSLVKEDLQKFWKLLRKKYKIRYIACGEYGPTTRRPHYHAIIFGYYPDDAKCWGKNYLKQPLKTSKELADIWKKGHVVVAPANYNTAAYVARYCVKKAYNTKDTQPTDGRQKEFIVASKMPAIGNNAITDPTIWQKIKRNSGVFVQKGDKIVLKKIPSITRKKWRELYDREEYYNWADKRARDFKMLARARETSDNFFQFEKKNIETNAKKLKILDNARKTI